MEGDGGFGGFLSLRRERDVGKTSGRGGDEVGTVDMLSSLSRNGLNLLAGGGGGGAGFSLKATVTGNWSDGVKRASAKVSGSGFSGFYRARTTAARPTLRVEDAVPALEQPLRADVENLSPDECWRLILKLGKRWPAWNKSTSVPPSPQEESPEPAAQVRQVSLDLLATRALEALAQTPDRHGRPPRSMLAPKMTTQEFLRTAPGSHPPTPTPTSSQLDYQTLPVYQPSVSSINAPKPGSRTAPLTIFYAGTVKVCEDVPEDKARLIMLFAEKAGIKPSARAPASPSSSCARPVEDPRLAPPGSSHPPAAALMDPSSVRDPSHLSTRPEDSNAAAAAEEMAMPPVTVTSRQGQGPPKLLPNARKSSLARFLDSRKRPKATSGSEGQPSKRLSGASDDAEDMDRGKSTIDSVKERDDIATTDNAEVRP